MERSREELGREKFMGKGRVPAPQGGSTSSFPSVNRSFAGAEACKQKRKEKKTQNLCEKTENKSECSSCNNWFVLW